jgi:hypothetical protein
MCLSVRVCPCVCVCEKERIGVRVENSCWVECGMCVPEAAGVDNVL